MAVAGTHMVARQDYTSLLVFVSYCRPNKSPPTQWLKTQSHYLAFLEVSSPEIKMSVGLMPSGGSEENLFLAFSGF